MNGMRRLSGAARIRSTRILEAKFVCDSCQKQQRRSLASSPTVPPPKPPPSGFAALSSRRLISVSGPDAAKYLQGVITASIADRDAKPRQHGFYTAFLNAQGRVLHDVFIYPDTLIRGRDGTPETLKENFLIEVDSAEAERLQRHIKRYKLRAKFDVRLLPADEATVWHAWNDDQDPHTGFESRIARSDGSGIVLQDPRVPSLGYRLVQLGDKPPALELNQTTDDAYQIRRYLFGVP